MAQIIEQSPGLGTILGSGLEQGLRNLADYKMRQLMERQQYKQQQERGSEIWRNLGIPEQQAKALGSMPQRLQQSALQEFSPMIAANMRKNQQQGQQQPLLQQLQGGQDLGQEEQQQGVPVKAQRQPSMIERALTTPNEIEQMARNAIGAKQPMVLAPQMGKNGTKKQLQPVQQVLDEQQQIKPQQQEQRQQPMTKTEVMAMRSEQKEREKQERERIKAEEKAKKEMTKEQRIEQNKIEKDNEPFIEEMRKARNASKYVEPRLLRQEKLIKTGKLPAAATHNFLKFLGSLPHHLTGSDIDFTFAEGASAVEFEKLSKEYMKFLKDYFGSRVLQIDVENFLKTIPDLSQTDKGKWRVIQNMKAFGAVGKIKSKAMDDIIEENGGVQPRNLERLVEKRTQAEVDNIFDQFIQGTYGGDLEYEGGLWGTLKAYAP